MAYTGATLSMLNRNIEGGLREWLYTTTDAPALYLAASYFSDATNRGMQKGDIVWVVDQSAPDANLCQVSSVAAGTLASPGAASIILAGNAAGAAVGFFGVTAVTTQPAATAQSAVTTTASTTTTPYGYTTSAQAEGIVTLLNRLRTDLIAVGLIKGSA